MDANGRHPYHAGQWGGREEASRVAVSVGTAENLRGGRRSMSNVTTTLLVGTALVALLIGCSTSREQDFGEMSDAALVDLLPEPQGQ